MARMSKFAGLVPFEDDYSSVCDLPYVRGMVFGCQDNECYACGCGTLEAVGEMDGAVIVECCSCGAQMRAVERAPRERAKSLRALLGYGG